MTRAIALFLKSLEQEPLSVQTVNYKPGCVAGAEGAVIRFDAYVLTAELGLRDDSSKNVWLGLIPDCDSTSGRVSAPKREMLHNAKISQARRTNEQNK